MNGLWYDIVDTPLGWMGLLASPKGLRRTTLPQHSPDVCAQMLGSDVVGFNLSHPQFDRLRDKLSRYFGGALVSFDDEPTDIADVPPFLRAAWAACLTIPVGETRAYGWLAAQAGRPNAARAAGQAMARNRLPIIIPCHRVIASDGSLGGFGTGSSQVGLKRQLLALEARQRPT